MKKISLYILVALTIWSCGSSDQGELVGVRSTSKWNSELPFGMTLIPGGSFTMGKQDEDIAGSLSAPTRTVTIRPIYMDETEITNSEYKEFVFWVRDSIVRTKLALYAELMSPGSGQAVPGLEDYQFMNIDEDRMTPYQKYMMNTYGSLGDLNSPTQGKMLNWKSKIIWDVNEFPSEEYTEIMIDSIYMPIEDSFEGKRIIDVKKLEFKYYWLDVEDAAR